VQPANTGAANILYRNLLLHAVCGGQEHIIQPFDVLHIYGTDVYRSYLSYTLTEAGTHVYEDLVYLQQTLRQLHYKHKKVTAV